MTDKLARIIYLYEDLMNTYGDSGGVRTLSSLLRRRGYGTQVDSISLDDEFNAFDYDSVFFGGGQDFEQTVIAKDIPRREETLEKYINAGHPILCICDGYQFMGDYCKTNSDVIIKGLGILPLHIVFKPDKHMTGDTKYMTKWGEVTAFESHSGQAYFDGIDGLHPLERMIKGYDNSPQDRAEGLRYRNFTGPYSHSPLLKDVSVANVTVGMILNWHEGHVTNRESITE